MSGSPTVISQGQPNNGYYDAIAVNTASNNYFVSVFNGNTSSYIYRETFGIAPVFTAASQVATVNTNAIISSIGVDSLNNILYFTDGQYLYSDKFGSSFSNTPVQSAIATFPSGVNSMVFDQADSTIYAGGASYTGSIGFHPSTSSLTLQKNYIYKITGVTKNVTSINAGNISTIAVPASYGGLKAMALDTATDTLYFVTDDPIHPSADDVAGIYAMTLTGASAGHISTVWSQNFGATPSSPLAEISSITIAPLTGDYYVTARSSGGGEIYSGNVGSSAAPVAMLTPQTSGQDSTTYPIATAIVDPPSISGISVTQVNGSSTSTGTVTTNGTVTIAVTFSQTVNVTGTPTLALNDGGTASYSSGSGGGTLLFTYTAAAGQNTSALAVTSVSGTIKNGAGTSASLSISTTTFTGLVVETTPPSITLSGTSTEAVQGGGSIAVLGATPHHHRRLQHTDQRHHRFVRLSERRCARHQRRHQRHVRFRQNHL